MAIEASAHELKPGELVPPFRLPSANRPQHLGPWDYKQHQNLVLFFFHGPKCKQCRERLRDLTQSYPEYRQLNTEVLAISKAGLEDLRQLQRELDLPFPLLSDADGKRITRKLAVLLMK